MIGNSRPQTFATEKLFKFWKRLKKLHCLNISNWSFALSQRWMTRESWWHQRIFIVMSGLFGRTLLAFNLTCQQPSSYCWGLHKFIYPYPTKAYIIGTVEFTFHKLQPRLDSKRNRRRRPLKTKPAATRLLKIITKHCIMPIVYSYRASNDIRTTDFLVNTIRRGYSCFRI